MKWPLSAPTSSSGFIYTDADRRRPGHARGGFALSLGLPPGRVSCALQQARAATDFRRPRALAPPVPPPSGRGFCFSAAVEATWRPFLLFGGLIGIMLGAMDREIIVARALERAEQHVIDGDRLIAQQKELIANLLAIGLDATPYRDMLVRLEQTQSLRVEYASKLRRDLLNASPTESSRTSSNGPLMSSPPPAAE
jgi:hypothetical protein